jgi:hypothetical protein
MHGFSCTVNSHHLCPSSPMCTSEPLQSSSRPHPLQAINTSQGQPVSRLLPAAQVRPSLAGAGFICPLPPLLDRFRPCLWPPLHCAPSPISARQACCCTLFPPSSCLTSTPVPLPGTNTCRPSTCAKVACQPAAPCCSSRGPTGWSYARQPCRSRYTPAAVAAALKALQAEGRRMRRLQCK